MDSLKERIRHLVSTGEGDPFGFLGLHQAKKGYVLRAFQPGAESVWAVFGDEILEMSRLHADGVFELTLEDATEPPAYRLMVQDRPGNRRTFHDPFAFGPLLSDYDLHLIGEGTHYKKYEKLGAHVCEVDGVRGVRFALWAPNARRVGIVGDFNSWDGRRHPMRNRGVSGVWELFVPGLDEGALYKFEILPSGGGPPYIKTDPYGFRSELRPKTASIVCDIGRYKWLDDKWLKRRESKDWLRSPVSIYEVHLGSWKGKTEEGGFHNYRELAHELVSYVLETGFTHIELLPVTEHPLDESWGYQSIGYFSVTSRHGSPEDFMYFVDYCHQNGVGVIMDWVPAHFPKDAHGLAFFDGTYLYEHQEANKREHPDWSTHIFNYGRNEVANFLLSSALFWLDKYHIDGLRVDAVASMIYLDYSREEGEWVPNEFGGNENLEAIAFIKRFNELCHELHPGVLTIAEESTAWPMVSRPTYLGGLGFSLKWNMGWMHDMLEYFSKNPVHRKFHHGNLTFGLLYAFNENFVLVLSHDEVVHGKSSLIGKMPGDDWRKFANLRLLYGYMFGHPGKKMLFMGGEFGQWSEWDSGTGLEWHLLEYDKHSGLKRFVTDLNALYAREPAMYERDFEAEGFEWVDFRDSESGVVSFVRRALQPSDFLIFVCNFTPVVRENYRIGAPEGGEYREVLNSDSELYSGSNVGNLGGIVSDNIARYQWPFSLRVTLPPLAMVVLKPVRKTD